MKVTEKNLDGNENFPAPVRSVCADVIYAWKERRLLRNSSLHTRSIPKLNPVAPSAKLRQSCTSNWEDMSKVQIG